MSAAFDIIRFERRPVSAIIAERRRRAAGGSARHVKNGSVMIRSTALTAIRRFIPSSEPILRAAYGRRNIPVLPSVLKSAM